MARPVRRELRVVIFQDGDWLCGQYIDFNLSAQARTLPQLYRALHKLIVGHIALRRKYRQPPFADLLPAPAKYREMWEQSKVDLPEQIISIPAPPRGIVLPKPRVRVAAAKPPAA
jgi:hypothetical protein